MIRQVDDISRDVRVAIDENARSAPLLAEGDVDTLSLDQIIRSKIVEGVRRVHMQAPVHLLSGVKSFGDAIYWEEMESGYVILPGDFMRLVVFEMDDWERPVYTAISTDDPEYARQRSRYKGVRGTTQRPVCAIGIRPEGRVLEFYSSKTEEASVLRALYMPEPRIDRDGGVEISRRCYPAAVYTIAALVLSAVGEPQRAAECIELAKSGLQ